jgi:hypothetical protein
MMDFDISPGGVIIPSRRIIVPCSPMMPTRYAAERFWYDIDKDVRKLYDKIFKAPTIPEKINIAMMAGSLANWASVKIQDLLHGATAYTAITPMIVHLWASALDDTFNGATAGKCAYGSYAALSLTNNTTIFAAGSGTTTYTKTWPSDAAKSWPTSTATGTNNTITYLGMLDGNLGTSADHGIEWCTVTSTTINSGDTPQLAQNAMSVVQD